MFGLMRNLPVHTFVDLYICNTKKETKEVKVAEENRINDEIEKLSNFLTELNLPNGRTISLSLDFKIELTMLDGKAVNALTDTNYSQACNVCAAKPGDMNNLAVVRSKEVSDRALKFGISSLHCWIRRFECFLHIGYKLENKTFQARTPEQKNSVAIRKKEIQRRCREELNLIVDTPKQGFGNTNTGNTARRAFEESSVFADILGIEEDIIIRVRNILKAVCSGYDLDIGKFKDYCLRTSEIFVEKFGWYVMPPTLHKLLEHGFQVADILDLPIGAYSEEAQEANNKIIRNARLNHSCKISRINTMRNQFSHLLIRTDPVISSISFKKCKSYGGKPLDEDVVKLLV